MNIRTKQDTEKTLYFILRDFLKRMEKYISSMETEKNNGALHKITTGFSKKKANNKIKLIIVVNYEHISPRRI